MLLDVAAVVEPRGEAAGGGVIAEGSVVLEEFVRARVRQVLGVRDRQRPRAEAGEVGREAAVLSMRLLEVVPEDAVGAGRVMVGEDDRGDEDEREEKKLEHFFYCSVC